MSKTVLITGVTGMDGSYLAKMYHESGWRVVGGVRRASTNNLGRLKALGVERQIDYVPLELLEYENVKYALKHIRPDLILNMAAQSFVKLSFEQPLFTADATALGPLRILEAMRDLGMTDIPLYQASSSEEFGEVRETPQTELTPLNPMSPYACAKVFAHHVCMNYAKAYHMPIICGILFNHEGELRAREFVTRKISYGLAAIERGLQTELVMGNLDSKRDWGYSRDYCEAIQRMMSLTSDHGEEYVIATNTTHSVREFIELAFLQIFGVPIEWSGLAAQEVGRHPDGRVIVRVSPHFYRPSEVNILVGDYTKAKTMLGWSPTTTFPELVALMVDADLKVTQQEKEGHFCGY